MWNRCHWRLLYYARENVPSFVNYLSEQYGDRKEEIIALFAAMNEEEHIYDFASKCGSWNWSGIAIMLVSCKLCLFLFPFSLFRFIHSLMDYWRHYEVFQEDSRKERRITLYYDSDNICFLNISD